MAIDNQVCFHRWLFADPVRPSWCITRPISPLGSANQHWLGAKLLPIAVLIYPVICVYPCHLLRAQCPCPWPNGREGPLSACPLAPTTPPPTNHPSPYKHHPWYNRGCKKTISKTNSEHCMAEFLAWLQCSTGERQLLQCLKTVFLKIQNVTIWSVFPNPVTFDNYKGNYINTATINHR